jgi:protein-disulfide isomerase
LKKNVTKPYDKNKKGIAMKATLKTALLLSCLTIVSAKTCTLHAVDSFVQQQKLSLLLKNSETAYIGSKNGRVVGAVFVDALCGHCKSFKSTLMEVMPKFKDARFNIIEYPIFGEASEMISKASMAAALQGEDKYLKFIEAMGKAGNAISINQILGTATALKMDSAKLLQDMDSGKVKAQLDQFKSIGESLDIHATPYVVVGDELFPGAMKANDLEDKIEEVLKKNPSA